MAPKNGVWMLSAMISKVFMAIVKLVTRFSNRFWGAIDGGMLGDAVTFWSVGLLCAYLWVPSVTGSSICQKCDTGVTIHTMSKVPALVLTLPNWSSWHYQAATTYSYAAFYSRAGSNSAVFELVARQQEPQSALLLIHIRLPAIQGSISDSALLPESGQSLGQPITGPQLDRIPRQRWIWLSQPRLSSPHPCVESHIVINNIVLASPLFGLRVGEIGSLRLPNHHSIFAMCIQYLFRHQYW
jgi:hypothetical protein